MSLVKTVVLVLAALVSTQALATHNARGVSHHHLGRRLPPLLGTVADGPVIKKRNLRKRCRVRPSASAPVANVGQDPEPTPVKPTTPPKPTRSPTNTAAIPPKTTSKPPSGANGYLAGTNVGEATYYGVGLGSCGWDNTDDDMIVAVSMLLYDEYPGYKGGNPNNNPVCGREIEATLNGKSVRVKVVDRCVGCKKTDLDFSPAAFNKIGRVEVGREKGMTWRWV